MKKKILVMAVAMLVLSMTLTPFAFARPWNEKNNEKFLDFDVVIGFDWDATDWNVELVPPTNPNKLILSWIEQPTSDYTITVEGMGTYVCGTHFEYSGFAVLTAIGYPPTTLPNGFPAGTKQNKFRVDYMYDFGPDDGDPETIDGTLEMLAVTAQDGVMWITTVGGTGDLQNVQIFATAGGDGHDGIVIGWPDIPAT